MLKAGAAVRDFTPETSQFLYGYPHVARMSEGAHDPLLSSALYVENGSPGVLLIANDIVFVSKTMTARARAAITEATGLPGDRILLSATHTHSGPIVSNHAFDRFDPVVPPVDTAFLDHMANAIIDAGTAAIRNARAAEIGLAPADATGIGTNRHDPAGAADLQVPVLAVRAADDASHIALMLVCSMHPTVMHEDSRLVSADFPGMARRFLQAQAVGTDCAVLHHTGCAGNQSPRHVTRANTFAEAERLGGVLGAAVQKVLADIEFSSDLDVDAVTTELNPPRREFPSEAVAEAELAARRERFETLTQTGPATEARTAECDVFGAEERLALIRVAAGGGLEPTYAECTPAEIQAVRIGPWCFVGWPAETYVEYALAAKARCADTFIISLANGQLQGYITTQEAVAAGLYESGAALFAPETGDLFVETTEELVGRLTQSARR